MESVSRETKQKCGRNLLGETFRIEIFLFCLARLSCLRLNGSSPDCVLLDRHAGQKSPKNKPVLDRMMFFRVGIFQKLTSKILLEWLFQPTFIT